MASPPLSPFSVTLGRDKVEKQEQIQSLMHFHIFLHIDVKLRISASLLFGNSVLPENLRLFWGTSVTATVRT